MTDVAHQEDRTFLNHGAVTIVDKHNNGASRSRVSRLACTVEAFNERLKPQLLPTIDDAGALALLCCATEFEELKVSLFVSLMTPDDTPRVWELKVSRFVSLMTPDDTPWFEELKMSHRGDTR